MDLQGVKKAVFEKLASLDPLLTYHSIDHTRLVCEAVTKLCELENITAKESDLLFTAALFHDMGFLECREGHEEASSRMARSILPAFHYTTEEIEKISKYILATKSGMNPQTNGEKIMKDADVFYLGTDDYFHISDLLFAELRNFNLIKDQGEWLQLQINFLQKHRFHTESASKIGEATKQKTLLLLQKRAHV